MRLLKVIGWIFLFILVSFMIFIAALPSIASSNWAKSAFINSINQKTDGKLEIGAWNMGWLSPYKVSQVNYRSNNNELNFKLDSAFADFSIFDLLTDRGRSFSLNLNNLQASLNVENEPVFFENVNGSVNLQGVQAKLTASGKTRIEKEAGEFNLNALLGRKKHIELTALNFPTVIIDQFLKLKGSKLAGLVSALIGNEVDLKVQDNAGELFLTVQSKQVTAELKGVHEEGAIQLTNESKVHFQVPLEEAKKTFEILDLKLLKNELASSLDGTIRFEGASLHPEFEKSSGQAKLNLSTVSLMEPTDNKTIQFYHPELIVNLDKNAIDGTLHIPTVETNRSVFKLFNDVTIPWQANAAFKTIAFSFSGNAKSLLTDAIIQGNGILKDLPSGLAYDKLTLQTNIEFPSINTSEVKQLEEFLGNSSSAKLHAKLTEGKEFDSFVQLTGSPQHLLQQLNFNASSKNIFEKVDFEMNTLQSKGNGHLKGNLSKFQKNGDFHLEEANLWINGKLSEIPVALVCKILEIGPDLCKKTEALIGSTLSADFNSQLNKKEGPLSLVAYGQNGKININAEVKHGYLTLNSPLKGSVNMTKDLELFVLNEILPFLTPIISAEGPINFEIQTEGFSAPLHRFSLDKLTIGKASVQLPKIQVSHTSKIGKVADILGLKIPNLEVWTTPIYLSMQGGIVSLYRTDMLLANTFPIAAWGTINLPSDSLNMSIGISGYSISKAFGISRLPRGYMLQIPLYGPLLRPNIDTASIAARITALVAANKVSAKNEILSSILESTATSPGDSVPEPTTNPLPWDDGRLDKEPSPPSENKGKPTNPLKDLKKEAQNFLKEFLKQEK